MLNFGWKKNEITDAVGTIIQRNRQFADGENGQGYLEDEASNDRLPHQFMRLLIILLMSDCSLKINSKYSSQYQNYTKNIKLFSSHNFD